MKALTHSSAARAQTSVFDAARWCAPAEDDVPAISGPVSRAESSPQAKGAAALRFPKASKLLRHADFQRVYKQGRRHFAAHMTVFYLRRDDAAQRVDAAPPPEAGTASARVGFTVGRVLGGAVERNRIKRRLREAVRYNLAMLAIPVDVVINPKKSALTADFTVLKDEVARAFQVIAEKESRRG